MSEYEHGSYELSEKQEDYITGTAEEADSDEYAKGYKAGQEDLYTLAYGITQEWHELKIVNDSQMLWLKELLHEMEKVVYYTFDGDV